MAVHWCELERCATGIPEWTRDIDQPEQEIRVSRQRNSQRLTKIRETCPGEPATATTQGVRRSPRRMAMSSRADSARVDRPGTPRSGCSQHDNQGASPQSAPASQLRFYVVRTSASQAPRSAPAHPHADSLDSPATERTTGGDGEAGTRRGHGDTLDGMARTLNGPAYDCKIRAESRELCTSLEADAKKAFEAQLMGFKSLEGIAATKEMEVEALGSRMQSLKRVHPLAERR